MVYSPKIGNDPPNFKKNSKNSKIHGPWTCEFFFQKYPKYLADLGNNCGVFGIFPVELSAHILSLPERFYNPITAMGFSAMFTFQLDNTKR